MADSTTQFTKPHSAFPQLSSRTRPKPTNKGKSCSTFLFKILFLALFLVAIPLFPSRAPDFVSQTDILTKFWELLHLLFIGIAVAYGLFSSKRNVELEPHLETEPSVVDDSNTEPSYVSKMFPDSAIFGDGVEIPCGYDEKRELHCWDPQYFEGGDVGVLDEQKKTQFLSGSGGGDGSFVGYSVGCDENNVVQSWNSEYYHSEPVVVVAQPSYDNGESGRVVGYKPLGLPVRSLKSVAREVDGGGRYTNESDSSSGSRVSSRSSDKSCRDREFGDMGPSNLENRFNAAAAAAAAVGGSASPIQWRSSRSRRTERERRNGNVALPSHFRPLSVDETKFEAFDSLRSMQCKTSFSSCAGMYSSLDSMSSGSVNLQMEEMRKKEASYAPALEKMNVQEEDMEPKMTTYVPAMENVNFQEGQRKTSYVSASENSMNFQQVDMEQRKIYYEPASESLNFQEECMGQRKTSFLPASKNNVNFQEVVDMEQRKNYFAPVSENLNFQEIDLGKKVSKGSSSRNVSMKVKGKYAAVSYPSHFRPMPADEAPFESLGSQSFQSVGSFSSQTSMLSSLDSVSSDNMNFQEEEDTEQEKTSHAHASENVNFEEEDMGQKKPFYVHASENANVEDEDMGQQVTSYVPASGNMNFEDVDPGKVSRGSSSRTGRKGSKGKRASASHPSHFRPVSVDETQFESLSSQSFQSMGSFSSQTSLGSSLDSVSSENMNSLKEDSVEKKSSRDSFSSSSPSPPARSDGETSSQPPFHARGRSIGSLLQDDMKSNMNDELRGLKEIESEDPPGNKKSVMHALQLDSGKPTSVAKASSRGKSVRTRRTGGLTPGTIRIVETSSKQTDEKFEKKPDNVEPAPMRKDNMKSEETDLLLRGISKKKLESYSAKPEVTFSNLHKRDKPEPSKKAFKEDLDIEFENIEVSSDEDVMSECVNDSGLDSEVDKKASEFIAKFKAQIRLQKTGSNERSKGQMTLGNYIR